VQAPALAPITAARFDADYLQNPKPVYPPMSRRMNEEGKVVLRVRVSAQGQPLAVEIKQSSGYARLDEAAKTAVERWRFVPARQGSEAIEASVLVPLNFTLSN
ncbi:MAG: periplasmic protein TonB, partial [Pseudomonadota bacterium]|nr:periplasmic protein TonB [Pseudomonadota bacterium]